MRESFSTVGRRSLRNCLRPLLLSPALFFRSSFSLWLHELKTRTAPPTSRATQVFFLCRRWFEGGGRNLLPFLFRLSLKWRTLDRVECAPSFSCMHPSSTLQTLTTNSEL